MNYLIFIPDVSGSNTDHLVDVGLECLIDGAQFIEASAATSPRNRSGQMVQWGEIVGPKLWSTYEWIDAETDDSRNLKPSRFMVGINPESRPTPRDLLRAETYPGNDCSLGDGNVWTIASYTRLEHVYRYGPDGPERVPSERWKEYCDRCEELQRGIFPVVDLADMKDGKPIIPDDPSTEVKTVRVADGLTHAALALSINYRLDLELACLLGLFNDSCLPSIIAASIDLPNILETLAQKKTNRSIDIPVI